MAAPLSGQAPTGEREPFPTFDVPGSELRVWLVTAAPGDAVWEHYGHNAIRVLNTETGRDVSYNWGIFDFDQTDFVPRFLQGRMLYMMAPYPTQAMIDGYAGADREVVLQELTLTPSQRLALRDFAERNALPENRDYTYHYFLDNCSTRVRDLLDLVLGGALRSRFEGAPSGTTYRDHTRRLTQVDPLIFTGLDLLLGTPADEAISVWDEMFLPMTLRDRIRDLAVTGENGEEQPLVLAEEVVAASSRPETPATPPRWLPIYLLLGTALGAALAAGRTRRVRASAVLRRSVTAIGIVWSAGGGLVGTLLVLLLLTDHTFAHWNENLFLFNPPMLGTALLLPLSSAGGPWSTRARAWAVLTAGIALAGLVWQLAPASDHRNAIFLVLALPAHVGLAYALSGINASAGGAAPKIP
jgi:hypothetical protein